MLLSENGARGCKTALQLTEDTSNMHSEHYIHRLKWHLKNKTLNLNFKFHKVVWQCSECEVEVSDMYTHTQTHTTV